MTAFLTSIEGSAFFVWLRESDSIWAFPTVLTLHTLGTMALAGASAAVDLRVLGIARTIPLNALGRLFPVMWAGFLLNFVTGALLFAADATHKASMPMFGIKLALVVAGMASIVLLRRHMPDAETTAHIGDPARRLAFLSLVVWTATITAGRLLAYV